MAKKKLLDLSMLIHYSTKIKEYITGKVEEVNTKVEEVSTRVEEDKLIINAKVDSNTNQIGINKDNITGLDTKYNELEQTVSSLDLECDGHPDGDTINLNSIEQYTFRNVKAGDAIEIPNITGRTDFIIECYADVSNNNFIEHKVIELNLSNADKFIYDSRYVDVSADGIKPKNEVVLKYNYEKITDGSDSFDVYTSDVITSDILERLQDIISIGEF